MSTPRKDSTAGTATAVAAATPAATSASGGNADLLVVEDLCVSLPSHGGSRQLVKDISFTVGENETVALVGESGSGKSLTSLALMGLLPRGAGVSGSVRLRGRELLNLSDGALRSVRGNEVAMVFQDPLSSLNPYYTVGLQIEEAYLAHEKGGRAAARRVAVEAMERVGIPDAARRVRHYPHQFSGGQRQRITIAMALVCSPSLLIADEPTTALDVTVQAEILRLLAELQEHTGNGMIFITHDLAVVAGLAQRVLVMRSGSCVEYAEAERLFSDPRHPYTSALLDSVPRMDDDIGDLKSLQVPSHASPHVPGEGADR
ncbi:ABC transporter ATP-binding protein [Streptomyces iconiensis]|uniref:ABC transporter ATP-binding protein n=1 Tax=Streptomyces iconiensis TaxID=1384038 RepID=UPI003219DA5A